MSGTLLTVAHRQWATRPADQRFQTVDELYASVNNRRMRSRAVDLPLDSIRATVTPDGEDITFNHGIKAVMPTHWAFGQACRWINAPADYMRRLPASLAVQNINNGIERSDHEALKFFTLTRTDDQEYNTLQAVTSKTYGRINDASVVEMAKKFLERTSGRFYNPKAYSPATGQPVPSGLYASDQDCFMFFIDGGSLLDAGPRAQLNRGVIMSNSETGARTFKLMTFLFNQVCGNHFIWGVSDLITMRIIHKSNAPERFLQEAAPALLSYANASGVEEVSAIRKAQDWLLPVKGREEVVKWLQKEHKFSKADASDSYDTAVTEEGDCRTLWHIIQGVTAYARGFGFIDARVELEKQAGDLMKLVA